MENKGFKIFLNISIISVFLVIVGSFGYNYTKEPIAVNEEKAVEVVEVVEEVVEQPPIIASDTVSMIMGLNPKVDKNVAKVIAGSVEKSAKKYSLSIPLILSLMFRESGFRPIITSKANCVGLMQINPKAHPAKVKPYKYAELYHIDVNVDIGCQILREYLNKKKTIKGALQSYLGARNNGYMMDILSTCVEIGIKN
jgi:hypothetical protein